MIVVGGVYREECIAPAWSRIFGSGGRAAIALSSLSKEVKLHAYAGRAWIDDAQASFAGLGVTAELREISSDIVFRYFHPLSAADLYGSSDEREPPIDVTGESVLCFGFVEGEARVHAQRVVFDPQNADKALRFGDNGSRAETLALVLNEIELCESTMAEGTHAVDLLRRRTGASVVVVKRGPRGALVYAGGTVTTVPARRSEEIFKIGSGDVFSAVFAHFWAEQGASAADAATAASHAVARYVETRDAKGVSGQIGVAPPAPTGEFSGPIYLAAPFFNLAQRWMVEELRAALLALGAPVFSPVHNVGTVGTAKAIAGADLTGLRSCRSVLAVVDGEDAGTLFEVGYARDRGIPVVALAERPREQTLTMLEGTDCLVTRDLTTAVYHAIWAALS